MTDPSLMRGEGWVRCCICGELHTGPPWWTLHEDDEGQLHDVCGDGPCAHEAGLA